MLNVLIFTEWKKSPPELLDFIAEKMKNVDCGYRKIFGYPAYFINGNMFTGVFADKLFLRLSEEDITKIMRDCKEISTFEPMQGRPMKGYVFIPKSAYLNNAFFDEWLGKSIKFVSSLPAKQNKK